MVEEMSIKHTSRVIYASLPDNSKAFIRYGVENNVMKILETYTPPQHRGMGIAGKLMEYAIKLAEQNGWLIEPICSYSINYFIKHPDKRYMLIESIRNLSDRELIELLQQRLKQESMKNK